MKRAKAVTDVAGLGVERQMGLDALEFHTFIADKLTLTRMLPMLGLKPDYEALLM